MTVGVEGASTDPVAPAPVCARGSDGQGSDGQGTPAVRVRGLAVVRDGVRVLDGIDWDVGAGSRWVLLGPNGSGKTTLLQVAGARLLPSSGQAAVLGQRLGRVDMRLLRSRVAMVSGALVRQFRPSLTAREVVVTGRDGSLDPHWRDVPPEDWAEAERSLARLGLSGPDDVDEAAIGGRRFGVLSEGERQRVLIARALMGTAELLLMDEPAAGLDLGARERLVSRLAALAADPSVPPLVLVTHHLEEIPPGFTHAALLRSGRIVAAGPLEPVLTDDRVSACFGARVRIGRRDGRWSATSLV